MPKSEYPFSDADWFALEQHVRQKLSEEIQAVDADRLLNSSAKDLAKFFEAKYLIDVPTIHESNISVDQRESKIDISQDRMRDVRDRSRPSYVPGTAIEVEIPFTGDAGLFTIQPTMYSTIRYRVQVRESALFFSVAGANLEPSAVKQELERVIAWIQTNLANLRANAADLNKQLLSLARQSIESRRIKLLADRNLVASLGFPMKERGLIGKTYAAPEVRRKLAPALPSAPAGTFKPEPILATDDYEHILTVIESMAHVMELSPSAFVSSEEETLRSHFLVQLNGHYEGQATGETFNYEGKTDILIRSHGKNIFIAECKFWGGAKRLTDTIDQLFRYSSWRDTKTAIILFNRNKDFSKVVAAIPETTREHPQYKRDLPGWKETVFRFCFAHRDDRNREIQVAILAFDIPAR